MTTATATGKSTKVGLWNAINGYHFEGIVPPRLRDMVAETFGGADAATRAFADKISRKLGWPLGFALRAIAEYKRFVYLGIVGDSHVTPSKVIDQVWHEHILFTAAYAEFCGVIGRKFDHYPELVVSEDQTATFNGQYLYTLDLYRAEFGAEPPDDIWGRPKFNAADVALPYGPRKKEREEGIDLDFDLPDFSNQSPLHSQVHPTVMHSPTHHDNGHYHSSHDSGSHHSDGGGHSDSGGHGGDSGGGDSGGGGGCSGGCGGGCGG